VTFQLDPAPGTQWWLCESQDLPTPDTNWITVVSSDGGPVDLLPTSFYDVWCVTCQFQWSIPLGRVCAQFPGDGGRPPATQTWNGGAVAFKRALSSLARLAIKSAFDKCSPPFTMRSNDSAMSRSHLEIVKRSGSLEGFVK
jgi:hypothetical protein